MIIDVVENISQDSMSVPKPKESQAKAFECI